MEIYRYMLWLWSASQSARASIFLSTVAGVLRMIVSLFFIWVSKRLVDVATGHVTGGFSIYIIWMGACIVLQLALSAFRERLEGCNTMCLRNELRYRYFDHLMRSRWWGKEKFHTGDMVNRLQEDVRMVADVLCVGFPAFLVTVAQLVGAFAFMVTLDRKIAWVVLFIMPVSLVLSKGYLKKMKLLTKDIRETDARIQGYVQEKLQNHVLVSSLGRTLGVVNGLGTLHHRLSGQVMKRIDFSLFSRTFVQMGFVSGYAVAFLWGIFGLREGSISFGAMTAFLQLVSSVQRPVVDLGRYFSHFAHVTASVERLEELTSLPGEEQGELRLKGSAGVYLENVSFVYPDGKRRVINDFSYDFAPGSFTVVVGETGSGKSTLVRLMLALLFPCQGTIMLYDEKQKVKTSSLMRCNFIYVPQGNTLMSGTVKDNLLLGNPDATEEAMHRALHTAVADFVFEFPMGMDTWCGEKGSGLSEGQAQRIAIARGLLHSGGILLLDEPTSALDMETEQLLMERLATQMGDKTIILVTHRVMRIKRKVEVVRMKS